MISEELEAELDSRLTQICTDALVECQLEDKNSSLTPEVPLHDYRKGLNELLETDNPDKPSLYWIQDSYIVKDKKVISEKIENSSFFNYLSTECRRGVSDVVSSVPSRIDFLMWIFMCSIPLDQGSTPPAIQFCVNHLCSVIFKLMLGDIATGLTMLDRELVRQLLPKLGMHITESTLMLKNPFYVGPLPIIYLCRSSEFGNFKVDVKNPVVHPDTEQVYKDNVSQVATYKNALIVSDTKYKWREKTTASIDQAHRVLATSLLQNLITCTGSVQISSINLSRRVYELLEENLDTMIPPDKVRDYIQSLKTTFLWVQYIRAYIEQDKKACEEYSYNIVSEYALLEDKEILFNAQEEAMFYFDMIHQIINPVCNLPGAQ